MKNRIGPQSIHRDVPHTSVSNPDAPSVPAVIPMPGRLPVSYRDWDLRLDFENTPLSQVPTGTVVHAEGTITSVVRLSSSRAMVVLSSDDGHSAHVLLNPDVVRMVAPALYRGYRMSVRGPVVRTTSSQPAGLVSLGVQVEVA